MNLYPAKSYRFIFCFLLGALTLLFIPQVIASTLQGPTSSTTGSYTISSTGNFCGDTLMSYQLRENNQTVASSCSISKTFDDKPTGSYNYTLLECEYDPTINYHFCAQIDKHTVTVTRDGSGSNPNGEIEVRLGDYNNDGLKDFFVKSTITASYILKQRSYNNFQLITGLTTTQINQFSNWNLATQVLAYVSDLNIDGTEDMMLIGINHYVGAADDLVIRSRHNSTTQTAPATVSAITTSKKRFLIETLGLSQDRSYLMRTMINNNAYTLTSRGFAYAYFNTAYLQLFQMSLNGSIYVPLGENPYDESTRPSNCVFYSCYFDTTGGQWLMYVYAEVIDINWDYSIFHPSTVSLNQEINKVQAGQSSLDKLLDIFESQLGYVSCNGIEDDQVDVFDNVHSFEYFKTNTCTFTLLARFINAFSYKELQEIGDDKMQFRARKLKGVLWWSPFYHASISDVRKIAWFSGYTEPNTSILFGKRGTEGDEPKQTLLVGLIISPLSYSNTFGEILLAVERYDNNLPYISLPKADNIGYNSNSFAKGLVDIVGFIRPISQFNTQGVSDAVDISINDFRFPGLAKPVPKVEFGK